jgi:hypothetical protein
VASCSGWDWVRPHGARSEDTSISVQQFGGAAEVVEGSEPHQNGDAVLDSILDDSPRGSVTRIVAACGSATHPPTTALALVEDAGPQPPQVSQISRSGTSAFPANLPCWCHELSCA